MKTDLELQSLPTGAANVIWNTFSITTSCLSIWLVVSHMSLSEMNQHEDLYHMQKVNLTR